MNSSGKILDAVRRHAALGLLSLSALGCGAVYPELATPAREPPPGFVFEPAPPPDLLYLAFLKAAIPDKTRDGRAWDSVGGSLPDPFAKLMLGDKPLIVTPVQANTLNPTWPNQKRGNYEIASGARLRVELWDSNPINNHPICSEEVRDLRDEVSAGGRIEVTCESGAYIELSAEPAHGKIGLGLYYEIRTDDVVVVRVIRESPAARAGVARGDQIVSIMGEPVKGMDQGRVRSLINSNGSTGLRLALRAGKGAERQVELKDGPIYPLLGEESP
ncbi:MAG TPA: PDZ domain-containing protein [Polyangiaceae bacterium]|nr:PDZ domain-containing protein [Polyangiaceae bacterium]